MKRRAMILLKVFAAALLTLWFSNVTTTPYTVQAQGAIGQPAGDPTGATTGTAADVTVKDAEESDAAGSDGDRRSQQDRHQLRVDAARRLPRDVHAGGLRDGGDRLHAREERRAHDVDELHDLPDRHARVLDLRLRAADGRRRRARRARRHRAAQQRVHRSACSATRSGSSA